MVREHLLEILRPYGQEHLLAFWERLDPPQQEALARQIEAIDFPLLRRLYEGRGRQSPFVVPPSGGSSPESPPKGGTTNELPAEAGTTNELAARAEPPPAFRLDPAGNPFTPQQARQRGVEALRAGELGVILTAGGQGTRLGFDRPKGMFPIGPLSQKSLFQVHVEKIVAAGRRYGVRIPLWLMTSPATHADIAAFLAEHGRFGLPEEDLFLFCQGTMPAVDQATGRVLLEGPGQLALSPDGHGGLLAAFGKSGALEQIDRRQIRHLFYLQVDNPLVDICGPEYVGYHLLSGSEFSTQVIAKRDPLERVGNVVQVDGRLVVIEYSDLSDQSARRRNPDGSLLIWAGSIAVHVIDAGLLRRVATGDVPLGSRSGLPGRISGVPPGRRDLLPFHIARKKVPYVDAAGRRIEPEGPNALKFERFIFDLMPLARKAIIVEVDRAVAFAPVKNASGAKEDTPETARTMLAALHRNWLRQAGAEVADDVTVEISPLWALDAEELAAKLPPGTRITEPTYFG